MNPAQEPSIDRVLDEIRDLREHVERLETRLSALEGGRREDRGILSSLLPFAASREERQGPGNEQAESAASWAGRSRTPQRLATISFVLVIALLLRTLTDNGTLDRGTGIVVGIAYCASLVLLGAWLGARGRPGKRVLPICGGVLLCTIAAEGRQVFGILDSATTYGLLGADALALAALGFRVGSAAIVSIPSLAAALAGLSIGFPQLDFVPAAGLLLLVALIAARLERRLETPFLEWVVLPLVWFFWALWGLKARAGALRPETVWPGLAAGWYLPLLAGFVAVYLASAARRQMLDREPSVFAAVSPFANIAWGYGTALLFVTASGLATSGLAWSTLAASLICLGLAFAVFRRKGGGGAAVTAFTIAGAAAVVLAAPALLGRFDLTAPLWSAIAFTTALLSAAWSSPGLRVSSIALQLASVAGAALGGIYSAPAPSLAAAAAESAALAVLAVVHWRYHRTHPMPEGNWFARIDRGSRADYALLWICVAACFGLSRVLTHEIAGALATDVENAFQGGQTIVVNCGAIALMAIGLRTMDRRILKTSLLVAALGGLKAFGWDLLAAKGVPLVLSVFSFGVAAAAGSFVLARLQGGRGKGEDDGSGEDAGKGEQGQEGSGGGEFRNGP
ncbi:MAG: hypothetical protein Fur0037_21670 [Planctomycetota bacterium]